MWLTTGLVVFLLFMISLWFFYAAYLPQSMFQLCLLKKFRAIVRSIWSKPSLHLFMISTTYTLYRPQPINLSARTRLEEPIRPCTLARIRTTYERHQSRLRRESPMATQRTSSPQQGQMSRHSQESGHHVCRLHRWTATRGSPLNDPTRQYHKWRCGRYAKQ